MVVYEVDQEGLGQTDIWLSKDDGSPPRRLTDPGLYAATPDWSPDGKQIIYTGFDGATAQLFLMNADGTNARQLTHFLQYAANPKWSPDGTHIAFSLDTGKSNGDYQIQVMNVDGSHVTQLTNFPLGEIENFEWSPDSTQIVFAAKDIRQETTTVQFGGEIGSFLYIMNADGTEQKRLLDSPGEFYPTWSPDGRQILFYFQDLSQGGPPPIGFYVINTDGTGMRQVLHEDNCRDPNWSWSTNKIVFVCGQLPGMFPIILSANMQDLLK